MHFWHNISYCFMFVGINKMFVCFSFIIINIILRQIILYEGHIIEYEIKEMFPIFILKHI
jgi:hypothetical protein